MKIWEFLSGKAVTLCFLGTGALLAGFCMALADVSLVLTGMLESCFVIVTAGWLAVSFLVERSRFVKLEQLMLTLPDKYLLGEVLPPPSNALERQYYQIMKTVSLSAVGIAEAAKREKEEYLDYVESWIHEMKTPLTACNLILANGGDIRKIRRELRRADNLTESILYYARLRTAEKDIQITKFEALDVIDEAVKSQMDILIAAGVSVEVRGELTVYSDRKTVCFILKQLLLNSAKYCPGCLIEIVAENGNIYVKDNGCGITDYELPRVTERGFTGRKGKRQKTGTGMGLYIVKELCRRLDIGMEIESVEGAFTKITFCFVKDAVKRQE